MLFLHQYLFLPKKKYMQKLFILILVLSSFSALPQDIAIMNGWKFKTGDQPEWANPRFNDSGWSSIEIGKAWEAQGYNNYDGFAWYRVHILIPSSIKEKAFQKEKLRFDLGKIDDGDEGHRHFQPWRQSRERDLSFFRDSIT
jgi:alpha-galactosidase